MPIEIILGALLLLALGLLFWKVPAWRGVIGKLWLALASAFAAVLAYRHATAPTSTDSEEEGDDVGGLEEDTDPRTPPGYPQDTTDTPPVAVDYTDRGRDEAIPDDALDPDDRERAEREAERANKLWDDFFESLDADQE